MLNILITQHLPHVDMDLFNEDSNHHDSFLIGDSGFDHSNHQHQMISAQTGLPPVNSGSPPCLPPSSNSGPCLPHEGVQMPPMNSHQAVYPMGTPQMPLGAIPYASAYGPPFIPASFNHVPLTMYPQTIIYEVQVHY